MMANRDTGKSEPGAARESISGDSRERRGGPGPEDAPGNNREQTVGNYMTDTADIDRLKAASILLLLSRVEFTDEEKSHLSQECKSFDEWKLFTDLAVRHGVAALVWQNICDLSLDGHVPEPERIILEGLRFKSIARVAYITNAAAEAVEILENKGIRVLLLKGLALEHTVYGSRGLRQMSDADLLVAPADAIRARDTLAAAGFASMPMKSRLYRHIMLDLGNHLPEMHRGGISVDLHYRLFGTEGEEMVSRAISEAERISAGGKTFHVLPPVSSFLGLVSHIQKHEVKGEFQMRLYADIYLLLKKHGSVIINEGLMTAAEQAGIAAEVRVVMTVIEQAWGLDIPGETQGLEGEVHALPGEMHARPGEEHAGFGKMAALSAEIKVRPGEMHARPGEEQRKADRFMHDLIYPGLITPESQHAMFTRNLHSMRGFRKKLIFIAGDIFPSVDFMKRRYGSHSTLSALLRYPHRLGKLIWIFSPESGKKRDK
ncbi:MAG: nucleotidyltransferase family protein [Bacteroidales bacterium]